MCSIAGVYGGGDERFMATATTELQGRGDVVGKYDSPRWQALSHRLGIVGGAAYNLPYQYDSLVVSYNGEIYNHSQLADHFGLSAQAYESDTHALAEGYRKFGKTFFTYMEGMYAFAIYDQETDGLTVGRDQFGTKPLFAGSNGAAHYVASEAKAFKDTALDTAFQVNPGQLLALSPEGMVGSYINYQPLVPTDDFAAVFEASMRKHIPKQRFALLLSGGIDSSLLAVYLKKHGADVVAYSARTKEFGADADGAARLAHELGIEHRIVEVDMSDIDVGHLAYRMETAHPRMLVGGHIQDQLLRQIASDGITIAMGGEGADELFAGYRQFLQIPEAQRAEGVELYRNAIFPNVQLPRPDRLAGGHLLEYRVPYLHQGLRRWVERQKLDTYIGKKPLVQLLGACGIAGMRELAAGGKQYEFISGATGQSSHAGYLSDEQLQTARDVFYRSGFDRFVAPDGGESQFFKRHRIRTDSK
jgi:asparagine synthase (glutamine-hydrolysing)